MAQLRLTVGQSLHFVLFIILFFLLLFIIWDIKIWELGILVKRVTRKFDIYAPWFNDCWLDARGQMLFQSYDFLSLLTEDKVCSAVYGTVTWLQARLSHPSVFFCNLLGCVQQTSPDHKAQFHFTR